MSRAAFRATYGGRQALLNLRRRLNDPAVAVSTAEALETLDCELFLREYEQAYADLRRNPREWAEVQAERRAFDGSLMDALNLTPEPEAESAD
jgi:hypothetical protein